MTKKRIAIFYESGLGRNDGPPVYWWNAMKQLGHDVTHLAPHEPPDRFGKFDYYIWIDWGEDGLTGILPYEPISLKGYSKSIYVASDTHITEDGFNYRLNKAKEFDYVFCNQERAVLDFIKNDVPASLLLHAGEPMAYPNKPVCIKKYDIGFVGFITFEKRVDMLDELFKAFPNFWFGQRFFEGAAEIFRKSRIVFNTAAVDDINMRVFETLATGSFLLTEDIPTLHNHFKDGEHLVTYKDIPDAIEKAKYYIKHDAEREKIAQAGYDLFISNHTYQHRVIDAFKQIERKTTCPD